MCVCGNTKECIGCCAFEDWVKKGCLLEADSHRHQKCYYVLINLVDMKRKLAAPIREG